MNPIASGTVALQSFWSRLRTAIRLASAWSHRSGLASEGRPPAPQSIGAFGLLVGDGDHRRR